MKTSFDCRSHCELNLRMAGEDTGSPGRVLVKRRRKRLLIPLQKIRKLIFWSAELELIHFWRSGHDAKNVMKTAGKYLRLHSVWSVTTPSSQVHDFNLPVLSTTKCSQSFAKYSNLRVLFFSLYLYTFQKGMLPFKFY